VEELFRHRLLLPSVLLTAAVLVFLGPAAAEPARGDKVALLVGITEYDHAKLRNLQYAAADVEELGDLLRQSGYSRVVLLTNRAGARDGRLLPVRENIQRELAALLAKRTKRDTVLVAFSGHGVQLTVKGKDEPFFCPKDGNPTRPETLVALNRLYTDLDDSGAGVKLLLVDACRTNPADKGAKGIDGRNLPELREGMGALFSCKPGERSYELKEWKHGAFFSAVLEALRPGKDGRLGADGDGDGVVDFGELARYISKQVPSRVKKTLGDEVEQHPLPVQTLDPLVAVVRLGTGTGEPRKSLRLSNARATYGFLGAPRPDNAVLPGDVYFLAFDIDNLTVKDDGEVTYRMGINLSNANGTVLYGQEPQEKKAHNSLGGKSLSAFAATEVGTNTPPGEYTVKVTVVDPLAKGGPVTKSLESKFKVLPPGFGVVRLKPLYSGRQSNGAAPSVLVAGQSISVSCSVVGFERAKGGDKQPNIGLRWRIIDEGGRPVLARPLTDAITKKVPEDLNAIPISLPLDLNRPGRFTIELQVTDRINATAKPVTVTLPILVVEK
jgi:hypothetical protein